MEAQLTNFRSSIGEAIQPPEYLYINNFLKKFKPKNCTKNLIFYYLKTIGEFTPGAGPFGHQHIVWVKSESAAAHVIENLAPRAFVSVVFKFYKNMY